MGNALHTPGAPGVGAVSPADARLDDAGLIAVTGPTAHDVRTGVLAGPGSLALITGTGDTAPMRVAIAPHHWVTTRLATDGVYRGAAEVTKLVDIAAAPGSGSRIDVVYVKQGDPQSTVSTGHATDATAQPVYGVLTGTVGAGKPSLATVPGAEELGTVTVAAGATATNGANVTIANTARQTVARGGVLPVRADTELPAAAAVTGMCAIDLATDRHLYSNGSTWVKHGGAVETLLDNGNLATSGLSAADGVRRNLYNAPVTLPVAADTLDIHLVFNLSASSNTAGALFFTIGGVEHVRPYNVNPGGATVPIPFHLRRSAPAGDLSIAIDIRADAGQPAGVAPLAAVITI